MQIPQPIKEIIELLEKEGYEAYVVGGCVRDNIMHLPAHDYDIATSALPLETKRVFSFCRVIETGIKHGTVTVLYKGSCVEITTFRIDGDYLDGRHPQSVDFSAKLIDDLSRRDFTVNGIAYSHLRGFYDPFYGARDITLKIIRCIGDPEKRFSEDALRILRALRFAAVFGFEIEEKTKAAIFSHKSDIRRVSKERIFTELKRLVCGEYVKNVILEFAEVFAEIIPELSAEIGYEQGSKFHNSTLLEHTARAVDAAPREVHLRLAMLFHDIGKPLCRTTDENGECHYYGHAALSAKISDGILRGLKCDNALRERVCEIVRLHDMPTEPDEKFIRKQLSKRGYELFCDILCAKMADDSAKIPEAKERIPLLLKTLELTDKVNEEKPCISVRSLAVNGNDLKAFIPPSAAMGGVLARLLDEVVEGRLENEKKALLSRAREIYDENNI
ncbi:MAG: HD domain-containing protein [Oscillospiraceae bacterium]|nr:HD domain-containing protein [Oscillospiraceae bacterium]